MVGQRPVGVLLVRPNIQAGSANLAGIECIQQRLLVHIGATGDIDDDHAVLHLGQALRVHQGLVAAGSAQHDHIGLGNQLVTGDEMHMLTLTALGLGAVDIGQNIHTQSLSLLTHHAADAAVADDAHGLTHQLKALGVSLLLPLLLTHGVTGHTDAASAGEQQGDSQLGNRVGRSTGSVLHRDASLLGIGNRDVVHTNTGADDQLQLAALGRVDLGLLDLGSRTDDDRVKLTQGGTQLLRLVKLLYYFMTVPAQLLHGSGIHAVGHQYTQTHCIFSSQAFSASYLRRKSTSACTPSLGMAL